MDWLQEDEVQLVMETDEARALAAQERIFWQSLHSSPSGHDSHCARCHCMRCSYEACPLVECGQCCGARLHACKLDDHEQHVCQYARVSCLNSEYGCPATVLRHNMQRHLLMCPASLVVSNHRWSSSCFVASQVCLVSTPPPLSSSSSSSSKAAAMLQSRLERASLGVSDQVWRPVARWKWSDLRHRLRSPAPSTAATTLDLSQADTADTDTLSDDRLGSEYCFEPCPVERNHMFLGPSFSLQEQVAQSHGTLSCHVPASPSTAAGVSASAVAGDSATTSTVEVQDSTTCFSVHLPELLEPEGFVRDPAWHPYYNFLSDNLRWKAVSFQCSATMPSPPSFTVLSTAVDQVVFQCCRVFRRSEYGTQLSNFVEFLSQPPAAPCYLHAMGCTFHAPNIQVPTAGEQFPICTTSVRVCSHDVPLGTDMCSVSRSASSSRGNRMTGVSPGYLQSLPAEVLSHILSFCDSLSLRMLAMTCRYVRSVCFDHLMTRGIVMLPWIRCERPIGDGDDAGKTAVSWKPGSQYIWSFTTGSSRSSGWRRLTNNTALRQHVAHCERYDPCDHMEASAHFNQWLSDCRHGMLGEFNKDRLKRLPRYMRERLAGRL